MRTVRLPGTDLMPSRLGFGTSLLMARLGRRESVRLLEVAHESGITHFDTARAYGYGEAESAVGEFLTGRRDAVTVTTKVGLLPPRNSRGLRAAKTVARAAVSRAPALRTRLRARAQGMVVTGHFEPREARLSLETSLRELRTDAVDVLLLHECRPADLETEGLLDFLEDVVREGKVRCFGLGTDRESTRTILRERPAFARVVQVPRSALDEPLADGEGPADTALITHSAVRTLLEPLREAMRRERRGERWSRELGIDCTDPEALGRLLLAEALGSEATAVVLFSSTSEGRIRSNAALAGGDGPSEAQVATFVRLLREAPAAVSPSR
jgi:D-threo-aldose 1-dehydrogenase